MQLARSFHIKLTNMYLATAKGKGENSPQWHHYRWIEEMTLPDWMPSQMHTYIHFQWQGALDAVDHKLLDGKKHCGLTWYVPAQVFWTTADHADLFTVCGVDLYDSII